MEIFSINVNLVKKFIEIYELFFYIYEKKWKKATEKDLVKIFNKFQNKILKESIKWEQKLSHEQKFGSGSMSFLKKK